MAVASAAGKISDGKAVHVTLSSTVVKGDVIYAQGWLGVSGGAGDSGDVVANAIAPEEYNFHVGAALSVAKGQIVYVDVTTLTGHLPTLAGWTTSAGGGVVPLFKATRAKDANNYVTGILLTEGWLS